MRYLLLVISLLVSNICLAQADDKKLAQLVAQVSADYDNSSDSINIHADSAAALARRMGNIGAEINARRRHADYLFLHGKTEKASTMLISLAREAEKKPATIELAYLYYLVAQIYSKNKYARISADYLRKGLKIAKELHADSTIADGYNRLGIEYERANKLDSALACYELSLASNPPHLTIGRAYSLENIAGIYARKHLPALALKNQLEALSLKLQAGKKIDLAMAYINIGETYDSLHRADSCMHYVQKAGDLAREIGYKDLEAYSYMYLSHLMERRGNYAKALAYHKRYMEVNDSVYNESKSKQLAEVNAKYQAEKKEQQIRDLAQRSTIQDLKLRQRNILLGISITLFVTFVVIGYQFYNRRRLLAQAALREEIARQQAITTREVLVAEERERKRIAADLHDGVGQLLSATLLNLGGFFKSREIDPTTDPQAARISGLVSESYDELRTLSHQMMPMALMRRGFAAAVGEMLARLDEKTISVTLETNGLDAPLREEIETILYRVIQECVNNVIKHAAATTLSVQIDKDETGLSVTIEDNGRGFDPSKSAAGLGLKNMQARLSLISATIDIDSAPGKGTLVVIHVPS
ncbi:MAG: sensor histidine kinase [Taibaiella sp.]|nr:sensor histidine kinase [Taibaiella sp.]